MRGKQTSTKTYLEALAPEKRKGLQTILKTIRAAAPEVEETFSYGIPGFRWKDRAFLWCAAWAGHYSIYPISAAMRDVLAGETRAYETSKGTIRFPADERLPVGLIKRLVKAKLRET